MKPKVPFPRTHYLNIENRREVLDLIAEEIEGKRGDAEKLLSIVSRCFLKMLSQGKGVSLYRCLGFSFSPELTRLNMKQSQALRDAVKKTRERDYPGSRDRILARMSIERLRCLQPKWGNVSERVQKRIAEVMAAKAAAAAADASAKQASQTDEPQSTP